MVKPIQPIEAEENRKSKIPDWVLKAFNSVIQRNLRNGTSRFLQKEVVDELILESKDEVTVDEMFKKGYLDVEDIYRDAGWKVEYDKPGYNESYSASFTFRK